MCNLKNSLETVIVSIILSDFASPDKGRLKHSGSSVTRVIWFYSTVDSVDNLKKNNNEMECEFQLNEGIVGGVLGRGDIDPI